jgi:hypothetical protein
VDLVMLIFRNIATVGAILQNTLGEVTDLNECARIADERERIEKLFIRVQHQFRPNEDNSQKISIMDG